MLCPIARSVPPCLAASPETVVCLSVSRAVPCRAQNTRPPHSTNRVQRALAIPRKPSCARWQPTPTLRKPGHDRHPQGLLRQPEPPVCPVTVYPAPAAAQGAVLFAAAYPPGRRHLTQLRPGQVNLCSCWGDARPRHRTFSLCSVEVCRARLAARHLFVISSDSPPPGTSRGLSR